MYYVNNDPSNPNNQPTSADVYYAPPVSPYDPNSSSNVPPDSNSSSNVPPMLPGGPNSNNSVPPVPPGPGRRRSRTWLAVLTTALVALLFGVVVFAAGWQYGRGSAPATLAPLQTQGSTSSTAIPSLSSNNVQAVREAVVANVTPAVVQINVQTAQGGAIGSGDIIDKRGYIVTNNHVVSGAQSVQVVFSNGHKETATIVGTDPADDLAVIKVAPPANMAVLPIGDSSQLKVGQDVLAVGNPLGITQTVTSGIVSALNRTVNEGQGGAIIPDAIQTDAPINPGNSGGALVNLQGQLVGIPTLAAIDPQFNTPATGVGFAIPSNRVDFIAKQIIQYGHVLHTGRAALGVQVTDVTPMVAAEDNLSVNQGALIVKVLSGGGAAKAGLQAGDVIVQIGNTQVTDASTLGDALLNYSVGQTVPVKVVRGNQQLTINVTLSELQG